MRIIILLGPPGSGKGTLAQMCEKNKFAVIGAGNLLRDRAADTDQFGLELRKILNSGNMVDNELILKIVLDKFDQFNKNEGLSGILFDGYPRNLDQMESLYNYISVNYPDVVGQLMIFSIIADDQLIRDRISKRFVCTNPTCGKVNSDVYKCLFCNGDVVRRADDLSEQVIQTRLQVFKHSITKLMEFFEEKNIAICKFKVEKSTSKDEMFKVFNEFVASGSC